MGSEAAVRADAGRDSTTFGRRLKGHRARKRLSQLDLSLAARVSARHISFLETGRSAPSREMVLRLATALGVSHRETNHLFLAAGYAPYYSEIGFSEPEAVRVKHVVEFALARHEPFSAIAFDRLGNIVAYNSAHLRLLQRLLPGPRLPAKIQNNILRLLLHPDGLRRSIVNWDEVAGLVLGRFRQEVEPAEGAAIRLLEELAQYDPPEGYDSRADVRDGPAPMLTIHLRYGDLELHLITVVATLGTAIDVTFSELRIETYFPADADTERALRTLARDVEDGEETAVQWNLAAGEGS